jgi:hypothetical protein
MNRQASNGISMTPTEQALSAIWKEILELQDCPMDVNYVDLGGTSVSLYLIIERINQQWGLDFDPQFFFDPERATLRDISAELDLALSAQKNAA